MRCPACQLELRVERQGNEVAAVLAKALGSDDRMISKMRPRDLGT
jgi:hypothetical protein